MHDAFSTRRPQHAKSGAPHQRKSLEQPEVVRLIRLARNGDSAAFSALIRYSRATIRRVTFAYFVPGADRDDVLQEALIGLFHAVRDYSENKGSFRAFANLCVERQVMTYVKSQTRAKHKPHYSAASLDSPISYGSDPDATTLGSRVATPEQPLHDEDHLSFVLALWKRCSPLERAVLSMYTQGFSFDEMGETRGKHYKAIDNAVWRVKVKAKKLRLELPAFEI